MSLLAHKIKPDLMYRERQRTTALSIRYLKSDILPEPNRQEWTDNVLAEFVTGFAEIVDNVVSGVANSATSVIRSLVMSPHATSLADLSYLAETQSRVDDILENAYDQLQESEHCDLSETLAAALAQRGLPILSAVEALLNENSLDASLVIEVLRAIGRIDEDVWYADRFRMLQRGLFSKHIAVRHGSILGLSHMDEPHSRPAIELAMRTEQVPWLGRYLTRLIEQLDAA